jgi:hypothetical protein
MITLVCVFLVVVFHPDFHPPPFPVFESDSLGIRFLTRLTMRLIKFLVFTGMSVIETPLGEIAPTAPKSR